MNWLFRIVSLFLDSANDDPVIDHCPVQASPDAQKRLAQKRRTAQKRHGRAFQTDVPSPRVEPPSYDLTKLTEASIRPGEAPVIALIDAHRVKK